MCTGGKVWGERPFCAQGVCVRGGWKGRAGGGGGKGPPVQGGALGKEGRKYGVGMGKNCPFMHETTALKPTMDGVGEGKNCPFMHGKRLLYSIDLLGGGAGYLCRWGGSGTLGLRGDLGV